MKREMLVLAPIVLCGLFIFVNSSHGAVCAAGATLQGVDVSVYQGSVNWADVKAAGQAFAFARVSDGSYLDTAFAANWAGIKTAGMIRGAYQYFEPAEDPTTQANIVIAAVGSLGPGDLPVVLDMEVTGGQSPATIAANMQTWIDAIETGTGRVPMIYTAEGFWNGSVGGTAFSQNPLWAANWDVTCPTLAEGWTNWLFWQYSDSGSVSGIPSTVDLDEFNGSMSDLLAVANEPSLDIAANGANKISVTWPALATGFVLQQTLALGTTNWTSVTKGPTIVSNQNQVILDTSTNQTFFRLYHAP
jgi:lysozyme